MTDRKPAAKKPRKGPRNRVKREDGRQRSRIIVSDEEELIMIKQAPFCCASCTCATRLDPDAPEVNNWTQPDDGHFDHRLCCHGIFPRYKQKEQAYESPQEFDKRTTHWAPPIRAAVEHAMDAVLEGETLYPEFHQELEFVRKTEIKEAYKTAKAQETKMGTNSSLAAECSRLLTSVDYLDGVLRPFQCRLQELEMNQQEKKAAVVLDAFAGIGTAVVCLKRLGIDMKKVIHVEHDKVATWVYKVNHYSEEDNIQHISLSTPHGRIWLGQAQMKWKPKSRNWWTSTV